MVHYKSIIVGNKEIEFIAASAAVPHSPHIRNELFWENRAQDNVLLASVWHVSSRLAPAIRQTSMERNCWFLLSSSSIPRAFLSPLGFYLTVGAFLLLLLLLQDIPDETSPKLSNNISTAQSGTHKYEHNSARLCPFRFLFFEKKFSAKGGGAERVLIFSHIWPTHVRQTWKDFQLFSSSSLNCREIYQKATAKGPLYCDVVAVVFMFYFFILYIRFPAAAVAR